jgi:N-acetylglutamate synthase
MPTPIEISARAFILSDYSQAVELWSMIDGLKLNESDTLDAISAFLQHNSGFSAVALDAAGKIIGAVLCGHNGRAGALYHLAVANEHRGRGIAQALLAYCFAKLTEANIPRCNIFVYNDNDEGNRFWLRNDFVDPSDWKVMQKHLDESK